MSVGDEQARQFMAQDIDQLDAIISKFMDYARSNEACCAPCHWPRWWTRGAKLRDAEQIGFKLRVSSALSVYVDETELGRVLLNLFENARRYGHQPGLPARVDSASRHGDWVHLRCATTAPACPQTAWRA